ncbi:Hsp33 family molecular chaperone HslO [uncultured Sneathia sp.]|uniref:Hsp33 family molecular chaperone HslO n=1 Tax=uncultured Sneathia sp. TaxID=278067 RepID=UPI00259AD764|nr:Hsp33 family molecular chaperone HslO [uncultured Sneathia sp.]
MKSNILIGISKNVRFAIADTTEISKEAVENSEYDSILCTSELALLNIISILSSNIKSKEGKISLVLKADGLLGKAHARARIDGRVISSNEVDADKIEKLNECKDLDEFKKIYRIGKGVLRFETDLGLKSPYYTEIDIDDTKNIEDALSEYYIKSEQLKTIIKTGIKYTEGNSILKTGAIFIQALPDCSDEVFDKYVKRIKEIYGIQELLAHDFSLEKVLKLICEDIEEYKVLEERELSFKCDCSREYCLDVIKRVYTKKEIQDIIQKDGYIETVCNFCNAAYRFKEVD